MNDIDSLERALLTRARGAIEPTEADRGRILQQLAARIAAASLAPATAAPAPSPVDRLRHLVDSHLVALSTAAVAVGVAAFGAGYFVAQRSHKPVVTTVIKYVPAPKTEALPERQPAPVDLPTAPTSLPSFSDRGRGGTEAKTAASSASSAAVVDNSLSEELDLLRRAERMIRAGNAMVALGLLGELDQRFPKGQLLEERAAARVMANCELTDEGSATSMGQAYLGAHPQSVYATRVRSICHIDSNDSVKDLLLSGD